MIARPHRSRSSFAPRQISRTIPETSQPRFPQLRQSFFVILFLAGIGVSGWLAFWSKPPLICRTQHYTNCSPEEQEYFAGLYSTRFRAWRANPHQDLPADWPTRFPQWEDVSVNLNWLGKTSVIISRTEAVGTVEIGEEWWSISSSGQKLKPVASTWPAIRFESLATWETWRQSYQTATHSAQALKTLSAQLPNMHPSVSEAQVFTKNQVELKTSAGVQGIVSMENAEVITAQLRTLQAVLGSSTMEKRPSVVDVRFTNVIIRE